MRRAAGVPPRGFGPGSARARRCSPPLLAQLQALVPGALEQLLVLLLPHLLPALLHEGRQRSTPFSRSFGSEEVPEVDPLRSEALLQTNGTQSKRFRRLRDRRDQPESPVPGHRFQVADPGESALAVGEADE